MSLRGRAIAVGFVAVLALLLAFPSFFSEQARLDSGWIPDQGINLGLDLQGGLHWLLKIDEPTAMRQELERAERDLQKLVQDGEFPGAQVRLRDDALIEVTGAPESAVRAQVAENFSSLQIERQDAALLLGLTSEWTEYTVERGVRQALDVLNRRIDGLGVREPIISPQGRGRILVQLPGDIDPIQARKIISQTTFLEFKLALAFAPNEELLLARYPEGLPEDAEIALTKRDDGSVTEALLVRARAVLTGAMLEDARVSFDRANRPIVSFTWNTEGAKIFREFTAEHIGDRMAAIIDGEVITAPTIRGRIGRSGQIEGGFTQQEAADLAVALRSGALPIPLLIEEQRSVGPSLGADSIRQGIRSILIGGFFVVLFMVVYYRTSGALANAALVLNLLIIIGLMSFAQATLTLPGIAGLVLTVGMAVDANVIIFERIREELRAKKSVRNAVQMGFRRSRLTILDANITTVIAAVVLLYYGRGPVQGFGVTLAIGIFSSVFCALVVTRVLVDTLVRFASDAESLSI